MRRVIKEVNQNGGYRFPDPSKRTYEDLIEAIVYQQLSIKAAKTIHERLLQKLGGMIPSAEVLSQLGPEDISGVGLSRQKENYVLNIARFFHQHELGQKRFRRLSDEEVIKELTKIKGVGVWTVEMILISSLGRSDVLPVLDLGIQQAIAELYGLTEQKKALHHRMTEIAEPWRPYRTYASLLLWRWKRIQMGLDY